MTWRTDGKLKSAIRRPLRDVSNSAINKTSKKSAAKRNKNAATTSNKKATLKKQQENALNNNNEESLHRLFLVHSDVSSLLRQIDEVVVQAVKTNIDNEKSKEIDSFTNVLSEIGSSLQPWIVKLQKALAVPCANSDTQLNKSYDKDPVLNGSEEHGLGTPEPSMPASLVSPSPLVSWRPSNCTVEGGKQLFALTPLPRPKPSISKPFVSVKSTSCKEIVSGRATGIPSLGDIGKSDNYKPENDVNTTKSISELNFPSPPKTSMGDFSTVLTTPCLRNSPPVACVLKEFSYRKIDKFHKSTPFPVGAAGHKNYEFTDSDSSSGEAVEKLGLKYPELVGIKPSCTIRNERRVLDESPAWIRSPLKCCTLKEPVREKTVQHDSSLNSCLQKLTSTFNQQMSLAPNQDKQNRKGAGNLPMVESTPLWKGCESIMKTGKRPGENTLKKELWTRFEAASSTNGFELNIPETSLNFLDKLEEASGK